MHNPYIHDLFYEGLGDIFFVKYYKFLNNKIKNKIIRGILISIHIVFYLLFLGFIAIIFFKLSYPL